ncbi:MAG TPA: peptidoglycan-binding protein [Mucilaginibacter sp.]|nr:peptidoglycan-binding protein [Mucilaginibacter sp.]
MNYPGHIITLQDYHIGEVIAIQRQLIKKGCGPLREDGNYELDTYHAVMLFQSRFSDMNGNPLKPDGVVGPITWSALFGVQNIKNKTSASNTLSATALDVARSQIGITEFPSGSNGGRSVKKYMDAVGLGNGQRWAMGFIYWCFQQACISLEVINPVHRTGDPLELLLKTDCKILSAHNAKVNTSLVLPGQVFIISTGGGHGHAGFVEKNENGLLTTIEGNICIDNNEGAIGVFRKTGRTISSINTGFIQFE